MKKSMNNRDDIRFLTQHFGDKGEFNGSSTPDEYAKTKGSVYCFGGRELKCEKFAQKLTKRGILCSCFRVYLFMAVTVDKL